MGRFISADTTDVLGVQDNLYDKNLYSYCDNNPVMREDYAGTIWGLTFGGVVAGAAINIITTCMAAVVTGQQYTAQDAFFAGIAGAVNGVKKYGALINGLITGSYAAYMSYMNGSKIGGAIVTGIVAGSVAGLSISNLASLTTELTSLTANVTDLIMGFGGNVIAAATFKAVTYNKTSRQKVKQSTPVTQNTKKNNINRSSYPSTRDPYFAGAYTYQIVGYVF